MTLRPNKLPARLLEFFERNPAEELTFADIGIKFGAHESTVTMAVKRLVQVGALQVDEIPPKRMVRRGACTTTGGA